MTEKEGMICNKFRLAKDKKLQIKIDADVYCGGDVKEVIDILTKYGYDVSKYKVKLKLDDLEKEERIYKFNRAKAKECHAQGMDDAEMATACNVSKTTITKWRKGEGLTNNFVKKTERLKDEIIALCKKGYSNKKIAEAVGLSSTTIRTFRKKYKLTKRKSRTVGAVTANKKSLQQNYTTKE